MCHRKQQYVLFTSDLAAVEMQVRQKLYKSSIGKWKQYNDHMQVAADMLLPLIHRYERDYAVYLQHSAPSNKGEL